MKRTRHTRRRKNKLKKTTKNTIEHFPSQNENQTDKAKNKTKNTNTVNAVENQTAF